MGADVVSSTVIANNDRNEMNREESMQNQYQLILFDMVGVLVKMSGAKQMLAWTEGRVQPADLWQWWINSPLIVSFESGRIDSEQFAEAVTRELCLPVDPQEFLATIITWFDSPFPETREVLTALHGRYPLAILSNTNALFYDKLLTMDLLPFFGQTFFSHLTGLLKPDPNTFLQVLDETGIPPEAILFFDDNTENIAAARQLGFLAHLTRGMVAVKEKLIELKLLPA